jgi:very-short-patch-repair endonuclease
MPRFTRISADEKQRSRQLRRSMTDAERRLWEQLRERQMGGYKFRRQYPFGRYVLDFVCLQARLIIEVDGGQHLECAEGDRSRTRWLEQRGLSRSAFLESRCVERPRGSEGGHLARVVSGRLTPA